MNLFQIFGAWIGLWGSRQSMPVGLGIVSPTQERSRLSKILDRHVCHEDAKLSDREFIKKIYERWSKDLESALIDPAE